LEEVLRYKKLDGVPEALAALASPAAATASPSTTPSRRSNCRCKSSGGGKTVLIPVAHAEALASRLPVHIEQTGHLPHMEKAGEGSIG